MLTVLYVKLLHVSVSHGDSLVVTIERRISVLLNFPKEYPEPEKALQKDE